MSATKRRWQTSWILLLFWAAAAGAFELPGGQRVAPQSAPVPAPSGVPWKSADGRLTGTAPAGWHIAPHQGTRGLKMTMDIQGNSVLRYQDTRPRPNAFRATLTPGTGAALEFEADYKPVAHDDGSDPWGQCANQLRRILGALTFMKPASDIERLMRPGTAAGLAVTLVEADAAKSTIRRISVVHAAPLIYSSSVQITGPVAALQQCSAGLTLLTSSIQVDWPKPNPQVAQRLPGIHRRLVAQGGGAVSTEGEVFLLFDARGAFADVRNTSTAAVGRGWTGDVTGWAAVNAPGLTGRGRYLVLDGFLVLLYDWVRDPSMDRFAAYPLTFSQEGIELDYRAYQRMI